MDDFLALLDSSDFDIIGPISEPEAEEAITLFSVVSMLLGGRSERLVGSVRRMDVLGVVTLYYGLQDKSLSRIVVQPQTLWPLVEDPLTSLTAELAGLANDVEFIEREAKRQFNLGRNRQIDGNADFPRLFRQYVRIAADPLLALDVRAEAESPASDKQMVARAFDLMRELKIIILQLVQSLSSHGTAATRGANRKWAGFEARAMAVLETVAENRLSEDRDDLRPLAVLADLTGRDFDTQVAPYVALARDGGQMLRVAMEAYRATKDQLESLDEDHLLGLFQPQDRVFLTVRMRTSASVLRQFRLPGWL